MMESDREQLDRFWRENRDLYQKDEAEYLRREAVLLKELSDNGSAYATVELFHNSDRLYSLTDGEKQLYHERICFMYENNPRAFDWRMLYFVGMGVAGERYHGKLVEVDEGAIREAIGWMIRSISEGGLNCLGTILHLYKYIKGSDDESFKWCVWGLKQPTLELLQRFQNGAWPSCVRTHATSYNLRFVSRLSHVRRRGRIASEGTGTY